MSRKGPEGVVLYARYVLLTLFALGTGWFLVSCLTVDPIDMATSLAIALACAFLIAAIIVWQFRERALIAAAVLALVGIAIGYTAQRSNRPRQRGHSLRS